MSHPEHAPVQAAAEALRQHFGDAPPTAIVLGSGLGPVVDRVVGAVPVGFAALGLPTSGVVGHAGRVVRGTLGGHEVAVLSGRVHLYEGWTAGEVVRGVRALGAWGVRHLVLTCSAGGISAGLEPGALVALCDHVNLMGDNPLRGPLYGDTRFPDLQRAYDARLRRVLLDVARERGVPMAEGVYAAMMGPSYETPAEIRMLRAMGADVVGMSTVPEILAAAQLGLTTAAIAVVSNRAAGLGGGAELTHDEVTEISGRAAVRLADVLEVAVGRF